MLLHSGEESFIVMKTRPDLRKGFLSTSGTLKPGNQVIPQNKTRFRSTKSRQNHSERCKMRFDLRIITASSSLVFWAILRYIEQRQWWTLRLKLSCWIPGRTLLFVTLLAAVLTLLNVIEIYDIALIETRAAVASLATGFALIMLRILIPLADSRSYIKLRWKAWTGPSRTGIAPAMSRYLGNRRDWQSLASTSRGTSLHPVEAFPWLTSLWSRGIAFDPTELLKARLRADEEANEFWVPRSTVKSNVYAPFEDGRPISLLWGSDLGFLARCSRGIMAVPTPLLNFQPKLKNGVDGRPICLAHGILARNKGLEPQNLVCNLQSPASFREFEENSALWPRPSKTLRSFYRTEMQKSYSGLGSSYVTVATELALLIADSDSNVVADWLDQGLEHQELHLNNDVAALGASVDDLSLLYRGQHVAMLVSLSEHRLGNRIRPELMVFRALCAQEGLQNLPPWLANPAMIERLAEETERFGDPGMRLITAMV